MSRYTPLPTSGSPSSPPPRRSSIHSIRRPSISSFRLSSHNRQQSQIPDPDEMDAAFDGPDEGENDNLLGRSTEPDESVGRIPGDYDFDRNYFLPPPSSPPPFQPYSSQNPAPGNTNGEIPTGVVAHPRPNRHFLGGLLPSSILPRQTQAPGSYGRVVGAGGGVSGVFSNLAARPDGTEGPGGRVEGPEWVPEDESKDGPPSYAAALRDAVPPYWDTTVVLPSSSSPFGPLSSSMSGDDILIDGMATGNFFGFFWNLVVSVSFQFVGFLLTYVLHTTHAAKYGSRVGLGLTLIQFGLNLRSRAEEMIGTGHFPSDPSDPVPTGSTADEIEAENAISAFWGPGSPWPATLQDPTAPSDAPPVTFHNAHEAEVWALQHNTTLSALLGMPSAAEVGKANEWFSFLLMSVGWFLVLTSVGGWWRVKRFERALKRAQRESEAARAAANGGSGEVDADGNAIIDPNNLSTSSERTTSSGPLSLNYYTSAFSGALAGAREIQQGFFGMRGAGGPLGRRGRGDGHAPLPTDEHELLDAQGFGLEPMATGPGADARSAGRGLWG